ncbi:MAG TPA: diacylglycerol kinase [Alphaproteobacteria bacterium]|nr:diacylglycerol kinase [Alphaproteobacteria bacterium]
MPESLKPKAVGVKRIINAFFYSVDGLKATFKSETAFRQEVILAAVGIPLAFFLTSDRLEQAAMVGSLLLVLIVELLNSAIEAVVDRFGPEHHPLAKHAKDAGSAAVLLALILTGIVWLLCLLPF